METVAQVDFEGTARRRARETAVRALSSPWSVVAIGVLVLNDHVLKTAHPGFLTGKASDVAGLVFFPHLLALCLSWTCRTPDKAERLGPRTAAITAVAFSLVQLWPPAAIAWGAVLTVLAGPSATVPDPTDLLALPAVLLAVRVWRASHDAVRAPRAPVGRTRRRRMVGIAAVPLAALGTIATSPCEPGHSISDVRVEDGRFVAVDRERIQAWSVDGRTWDREPDDHEAGATDGSPGRAQACSANRPELCWRVEGEVVERSGDGGTTWELAWAYPPGRRDYVARETRGGPLSCRYGDDLGPHNVAVLDTPEGAVAVVAMGEDGVLRLSEEGGAERLPVLSADPWELTGTAGGVTLILAALAGTLVAGVLAWSRSGGRPGVIGLTLWLATLLQMMALILIALVWIYVPLWLLGRATVPGTAVLGVTMGVVALAGHLVLRKQRTAAERRPVVLGMAAGGLAAVVVAAPEELWQAGVLPSYAARSTVAIVVGVLVVGLLILALAMPRPRTAGEAASPGRIVHPGSGSPAENGALALVVATGVLLLLADVLAELVALSLFPLIIVVAVGHPLVALPVLVLLAVLVRHVVRGSGTAVAVARTSGRPGWGRRVDGSPPDGRPGTGLLAILLAPVVAVLSYSGLASWMTPAGWLLPVARYLLWTAAALLGSGPGASVATAVVVAAVIGVVLRRRR